MYAENPFLLEISLQSVRIILFSVLAVAMIGMMISDGFGEDAPLGPDYSGVGDGNLVIYLSIILIPILLIIIIVILVVIIIRRRK